MPDNLDFLDVYISIPILAFCLIVGFVIKLWIKDVDNKWIPTIVTVLGGVCGVALGGLNFIALLSGMCSGLLSTGLHQLLHQLLTKYECRKPEDE